MHFNAQQPTSGHRMQIQHTRRSLVSWRGGAVSTPARQRSVCVATARAIATLLLPRAFTIWASLFPFAHFLPRAPTARATPHQNI